MHPCTREFLPSQPQTLDANPCVVPQYCGQAAYLMDHPEKYTDAFWSAMPTPIFWPMFIFGTLAAIVASQACPPPPSPLEPLAAPRQILWDSPGMHSRPVEFAIIFLQ